MTPKPTILDAMVDQTFFGKTFRRGLLRGDSWRAWRAFLAALFGLALDEAARELFQIHTGRTDVPNQQLAEAFCICGRRSGKSIIAALVAIYLACFRDYSDVLAPGEIGVLPIIAPDRKQCRVILNYIAGFFDSSPTLNRMVKTRLKESIELTNRIRIEVHTASFRTVRGYTAIGAILDEVAFLPTDDSANPASELISAIVPAMATIPNALLLAISSPYARRGILWETYKEHFGKNGSPVLVWQGDTRSMNPTVSRLVIEAAYLRDKAAARAEYGAEFRSDIESFLTDDVIDGCTVQGCLELAPAGAKYIAFCDPSGGSSDSMTLAIAHFDKARKVAVLDLIRETHAPFSPEQCVQEFAADLDRYRVNVVTGDRYGGEWPREQFRKRKINYEVSELTRSEIYLELLPGLMSRQCELLDHKRLRDQLLGLERRTGRSGKDSVDHPPGSHDDVANAAAGALVETLRAASGAGLLGVVEYIKALERGDISLPTVKPPLPQAQPAPSLGACPDCGAICRVRMPGVGIRCNQCGRTDSSGVPRVTHPSRRDVSSGSGWREKLGG